MLNLKLSQIEKYVNGELNDEKYSDLITNTISNDTRTLQINDLYFPIKGENFDGHNFINTAFENGAIATISERNRIENTDRPIIYVDDSNKAFTDLARNYRASLNTKIIALTGSNGKTTTKDLIFSVLEDNYRTKKTIGNLNNLIGVPKTLFTLDNHTEVGVVEMGTDSFGEIEILSNTAIPDIAIITNIGDSHLEQLKTKENIAIQKLHIIDGLSKDGIFIYNNDDDILRNMVKQKNIKQKTINFGIRNDSNYKINIIESNNKGSIFSINDDIYTIPLIGKHQIYNSAIAIIISKLFNIPKESVIKSLSKKDLTKMRSDLLHCNGFDILDDSYKSNPQSLRSALETLYLLDGYDQKIVVLGDMAELGEDVYKLHTEIGSELSSENIDYLILYGELSKLIEKEASKNFPAEKLFRFEIKEDILEKIKSIITKNSILLIKGSRFLRLEEIVKHLQQLSI